MNPIWQEMPQGMRMHHTTRRSIQQKISRSRFLRTCRIKLSNKLEA